MTLRNKIDETLGVLKPKLPFKPKIGLILGSGLGPLADEFENAVRIPYTDLPHFPAPTVEGHAGRFVCGTLFGVPLLAMQGRYHYYEGHSMETVTFPVRVMQALGIHTLIVTNAAGGVNETYKAGNLMLIKDHINWMTDHPLRGRNDESLGVRFPDMSSVYDEDLGRMAKDIADDLDIPLQTGVYFGLTGPSYETPAEVRMIRKLGGDAVGMSTVPEAIVARHAGMKVLGISCITNAWTGETDVPLTHEEVIETTERTQARFTRLVKTIIKHMGESAQ
ncbi:purine-nucleoside phosphorylase [Camelliibacillus cellulosilyticus]|uniref:Purine nucleoside phosphorylase n=1 Tax=Camelliibacillus cellulosilyticus TaxID=2174486 RepID=A0ABV9GHW9_9BACL